MAASTQDHKSLILLQRFHQLARLLLAVVAVSMLLLAVNLVWMLSNSSAHQPTILQAALLIWLLALLYGGVCGLVAARSSRLALAGHVVACWLLIAALHVWYLVDSRHRLLHLPQASSWSLIAKTSADLLCILFIAVMALVLRWNRVLLPSTGGLMLHTVVPMSSQPPSSIV